MQVLLAGKLMESVGPVQITGEDPENLSHGVYPCFLHMRCGGALGPLMMQEWEACFSLSYTSQSKCLQCWFTWKAWPCPACPRGCPAWGLPMFHSVLGRHKRMRCLIGLGLCYCSERRAKLILRQGCSSGIFHFSNWVGGPSASF